jgi:hypothetical protein
MLFPEPPEVDLRQRATARAQLRYEEICQDGRVLIAGLPHALGAAVWVELLGDHPITAMTAQRGIVPILTRMVLAGEERRISIDDPLEARGCFQLAHAARDGRIERLFFNAWVDLCRAAAAGDPDRVGRVFAEHVFTRPFAPPDRRKVTALEHPALPEVPPDVYPWRPPDDLLALPPGARWVDARLAVVAHVAFALHHTDSNQHVNSLVYLRLFEHEVVQRIAALGRPTALLSRRAELTYRKPSFAGERQAIALRCFEAGDRIGAAGCFLDPAAAEALDGAAPTRARCFVRLWLAP